MVCDFSLPRGKSVIAKSGCDDTTSSTVKGEY